MYRKMILSMVLLQIIVQNSLSYALEEGRLENGKAPISKFYVSSNMDGAIFSMPTDFISGNNGSYKIRFGCFLNYGVTFNYDINKYISVFTGIGIKNIGFIKKDKDSTVKYRTYNLGVPFGLKLGNIAKKEFAFLGIGEDLVMNYNEKEFASKDALLERKRHKLNEWFGGRTTLFTPYIFLGVGFRPNLTLKLQYYFQNFFNSDFTSTQNGVVYKPYENDKVNLVFISACINIDYGKKGKLKDESDEEDND